MMTLQSTDINFTTTTITTAVTASVTTSVVSITHSVKETSISIDGIPNDDFYERYVSESFCYGRRISIYCFSFSLYSSNEIV